VAKQQKYRDVEIDTRGMGGLSEIDEVDGGWEDG
jgi:hypothetical protein